MSTGKSVRLFLADGTPGGLLTAEIMNWTGHVVAAPRSDLPALLTRAEAARTGVYILLGDDPDAVAGSLAYIGEGDDVGERLKKHARSESAGGKDFWSRAIVFTSKDANLTKAHVRYLESEFIRIASSAQRSKLANGTHPSSGMTLPEADRSDMDQFVEQARIILPVLGVNLLREATRLLGGVGAGVPPMAGTEFVLRTKKDGEVARAREVDGEFTVLAGSLARQTSNPLGSSYWSLRQLLEQQGVIPLVDGVDWRTFAKDYVFSSPSAAAAVVLGRNANGRVEWRVAGSDVAYGVWQSGGLNVT